MLVHPFFSILAALALTFVSAQATLPVTTNGREQFLSEINFARTEAGVFENLVWSEKLAMDASLFARYRRDKFRCTPGIVDVKKYGVGNTQWLGYSVEMSPRDVVQEWVKDRYFYDHDHNSCIPANYPCGDYIQLVWRKSQYLGCARAACGPDYGGVSLTVCFYYPPGNVPGESPY